MNELEKWIDLLMKYEADTLDQEIEIDKKGEKYKLCIHLERKESKDVCDK